MLEVGVNLVLKVFSSQGEKKKFQKDYGQIIHVNMSDYGVELQRLISDGHLNDFSLSFDEKLEILEEGLDLMKGVLGNIQRSDIFTSLLKEDRKGIIDLDLAVKEKKENIHNDDYYDEEYEVNADLQLINDFYMKGMQLLKA